jgi:phospholipid/cholesterol/gamma-HCH transport system permease protein
MLLAVRIGLRNVLAWFGSVAAFGARGLWNVFQPPLELSEIGRQIYEVGYRSLPLIAAAGFAVGAVMSMHTRASLVRFGAESLIPMGLGMALIKETGPLVTALLFSGRVGAGIGAELGAMRVTEQIDALESLAVDSFKHLVVTRIVACMIALPLLTIVMNFTGIVGGYTAETVISGMSFNFYFDRALSAIDFDDYIPATMKTVLFGFIIATVSSYFGYFTKGGTAGVGQASTRSVVFSSILVILSNVIVVKAIFFFFPGAAE